MSGIAGVGRHVSEERDLAADQGTYGPNSAQVDWVYRRLEAMSVDEWRRLCGQTLDAEQQDHLDDVVAGVRARGQAPLIDALLKLPVELAERAAQASQKQRGDLEYNEVPISASSWMGEVEGTRKEFLAPQDRFAFRRAARNVLALAAIRPFVGQDDFAALWAPFEGIVGLLAAEREGRVRGRPAAPVPGERSR